MPFYTYIAPVEARYIKESKLGHAEIPPSFNCIPKSLEHCVAEASRGCLFLCSHTEEIYISDGEKSLEKRRVLCKELSVKLSFRLSDHFQADVVVISSLLL